MESRREVADRKTFLYSELTLAEIIHAKSASFVVCWVTKSFVGSSSRDGSGDGSKDGGGGGRGSQVREASKALIAGGDGGLWPCRVVVHVG